MLLNHKPSTAKWTEQQFSEDTFTHNQQWESNPRHFDFESNIMSTRPR